MTTSVFSTIRPDSNARPATPILAAWLVLTWGLLIVPILSSLVGPGRSPNEALREPLHALATTSPGVFGGLVISGLNAALLGAGLIALIIATRYPRPTRSGIMIWLGAIALSVGPILSTFHHPGSPNLQELIRLPLFFTAIYFLSPVRLEWFVKRCKSAIEIYTFTTLAALVAAPGRVMQFDYDQSVIEAFTVRLHGISSHANSFGPLLAVYVVLAWIVPAQSFFQRLKIVLITGALIMTQSKTSLIALGVMYAIYFVYAEGRGKYAWAYASLTAGVTGILSLTLVRPTWDRDLLNTIVADDQFTTLTGRTELWQHSLSLWRNQPVLGLGPEQWHVEMTVNYGLIYGWVPYSAHNQVIQTLGEAGIIGLAGLILFVLIFLVRSIGAARITNGASLALVIFLLIRSATEAPISRGVDVNAFVLFVMFALLLLSDTLAYGKPHQSINQRRIA